MIISVQGIEKKLLFKELKENIMTMTQKKKEISIEKQKL